MSTPTIDKFLSEIATILRGKNGWTLQDYLILEPPLPDLYKTLIQELRQFYPAGAQSRLETKCDASLPGFEEGTDVGGSWMAFVSFLVQYFAFLRDVNVEQLVETYKMLKSLLSQCILALSDASMGIVVLPTVVSFSRTLARLAIGLDKRPELVAHLMRGQQSSKMDEGRVRVTLVELCANTIREAFTKCLGVRSGDNTGLTASGEPEGRRVGIYVCANICLKLFFHDRILRSAEFMFGQIYQHSPPLTRYPASQRVTFLYYLGRYWFANNHFARAQLALQAAYDQCHRQSLKQRRLILIYLIASNMILGRFPSNKLFSRPEAAGLGERFIPICHAMRKGDLATFKALLDINGDNSNWFLKWRILFQMRNRCEVHIWRSLARKTFLLSGFKGDNSKKAPFMNIEDLRVLAFYLERRHQALLSDTDFYAAQGQVDPDLEGGVDDPGQYVPTIQEVESIVASMINQDLLHGYISHKYARFVITGAKTRPPVEIGFPNLWDVIQGKTDKEVPGWVTDERTNAGSATQTGGRVIHLSGARPVGAGPA